VTTRSSCVGAHECGLAHQGLAAYGVVLLALGILALGVTLLALTWRRTPFTSEETENDARDAHLAGDA
jgi:hypothetical protein